MLLCGIFCILLFSLADTLACYALSGRKRNRIAIFLVLPFNAWMLSV
ncbi:hypothetical protein HMPREF9141_0674 [Prevotella multiformis DSM 16608]|uniref:Uncharacterized protein n=1 Tax=Prevotella multiformis DSM 16608 TaxID=888743 RepID=F0F508_9BACT|nr:hypothetical protein HMPREF9141_0674 [Prevotella multiformis DSM 16608]